MSNYYVWLDAGHSKATPGKRNTKASPDFFEYEFNNDIAKKLKKRLEQHGITVYLTNTTPTGADISLTTRANRANTKWKALGKPANSAFVSIHGNASTGAWATARGVEVYHAGNASAKSKNLALLLTNQIYQDIKVIDSGFKNRGRKSANFTVIYKAQMPAVLIEHGFYDNQRDLKLMQNNRDVFVEADCKAICKHFGITYRAINEKKELMEPYLIKVIYPGADGLNVRKGPGTEYDTVTQIHLNQVFTIVEEKNGWGKLKSGVGWISLNSKYVKEV